MNDAGRSRRIAERWSRLLGLAEQRGVLVTRREVDGVDSRSWDGFWRTDPKYGAALMINAALPDLYAQWICAHELGHDITNNEYLLFPGSEVLGAISKRRAPGRRWQKPKRSSIRERIASEWAARQLVSAAEFKNAEAIYPCSLPEMANHLALHPEVLHWASVVYAGRPASGTTRVSPATLADLSKPNRPGGGGHQNLIGILQAGLCGEMLTLKRTTFNRLRSYNRNAGGGFGGRYENILKDLSRSFQRCGGIHHFFQPDQKSPKRKPTGATFVAEQLELRIPPCQSEVCPFSGSLRSSWEPLR